MYTADVGPIAGVDRDLMGDMVNDLDGSLTGTAGSVMVTSHPMVNDASTRPLAASVDAYVSPYRYARLEMFSQNGNFDNPGDTGRYHTVTRSDGAKAPSNVACPRCVLPIAGLHPNTPVIVNSAYTYTHTFDNGVPPINFTLNLNWAKAGDTVVAIVPGANPPNTQVSTTGWTRAASVAALTASTGHAWLVTPDGSLYLKMQAAGADWFATDSVSVVGMGAARSAPAAAVSCATGDSGTCVLPAGAVASVYYGANGSYLSRSGQSGSVACNQTTFGGDPTYGVVKACLYVTTSTVPGAPQCAMESGTCSLPAGATANVFYGANGVYATRQGVTGSVACSPTGFGVDPLPNVVKSCFAVVTAVPSGVAVCGNDNATCTVPSGAKATVFYGQNGVHIYRGGLSGSFACTPDTFGGDPLSGVLKSCRF